ncbi:MAG: AMP-binding protein, partial [Spirochaetota bacterium]
MERTVIRMFDEAVSTFATEAYALRKTDSGYEATSYAEARDRSRCFAAALIARGFERGDSAAILAEGSPEWIIAEMGLLMAGCVSVPLSIKLLGEEIPFRLDHSQSRAILTTRNQFEKVLGSLGAASSGKILIGYLDEDLVEARRVASGSGVDPERIVGFAELLAEGRALLADPAKGMP